MCLLLRSISHNIHKNNLTPTAILFIYGVSVTQLISDRQVSQHNRDSISDRQVGQHNRDSISDRQVGKHNRDSISDRQVGQRNRDRQVGQHNRDRYLINIKTADVDLWHSIYCKQT